MGFVTAWREVVLRLTVLGPGERSIELEMILDTGFTGHLTLPPRVVGELALPLRGSRETILADGSSVDLDVHIAEVMWQDRRRPVPVLAAQGGALAGMALIWDHRVVFHATGGGELIIEPL